MDIDRVIKKYLEESKRRAVLGIPLVEYCEYCRGKETETSVTGYRVCKSCGAEMKKPLGTCFGVPVYDVQDFTAISESFFDAMLRNR